MQFKVENMSCGSCAKHIETAVKTVDAAARVEVDTVARSVRVQTGADRSAIEKALADAGYPATPA